MQLKQSAAFTTPIGPIVDTANAAYAGAVIGDLTIWKNGTPAAMAAAATLTHVANGIYTLVGTTVNSDTYGRLDITCNKSGYRMPPSRFMVLPPATFDALVTYAAGGESGLPTCGESEGTFNLTNGSYTMATAANVAAVQAALPLVDSQRRVLSLDGPTNAAGTSILAANQAAWTLVNSSFVGDTLVMTAHTGTARCVVTIDRFQYIITCNVSCAPGDEDAGALQMVIYDNDGTTALATYTLYNGVNKVAFSPKLPAVGVNGTLKIFNSGGTSSTATFSTFVVERVSELLPEYWVEGRYKRDESGSTTGTFSATWFKGANPVLDTITLPTITIKKFSNNAGLVSETAMTPVTGQANRMVYVGTPDATIAPSESPSVLFAAVIDGQRRECPMTFVRDVADV